MLLLLLSCCNCVRRDSLISGPVVVCSALYTCRSVVVCSALYTCRSVQTTPDTRVTSLSLFAHHVTWHEGYCFYTLKMPDDAAAAVIEHREL